MSEAASLADAIAGSHEADVRVLLHRQLDAGVSAADILAECNRGMVELGNRFAGGECYLPDLMFGGMMMKEIMAELSPRLAQGGAARTVGKVVIGSVEHDVHDIGKDIVVLMLRGSGFEVIDLGVDVPPAQFVAAVQEHHPAVLGMSVLLTTCYRSVVGTVNALREAGVRDGLAIMVGGAAASDLLAQSAGCDYYGKTAVDGAKFAAQTIGIA